jgi:hypothetical protein
MGYLLALPVAGASLRRQIPGDTSLSTDTGVDFCRRGRCSGGGSHTWLRRKQAEVVVALPPASLQLPNSEGNVTMRHQLYLFLIAMVGGIVFFCHASRVSALEIGDRAPAFSLPATTVEKVTLADYLGNKHVVLFFYIAALGRA